MAEEQDGDNVPNPVTRWTCEACGCHSNTETVNPSSCGICGTSRRGPNWIAGGGLDSSSSSRRLMMRLELFGRQGEPRFSLHDPSNADDLFEELHGMEEDIEDDDDETQNPFESVFSHGNFVIRDGARRFDRHASDALQAAGVTDGAFAISDLNLARRSISSISMQNNSIDVLPRRSPRLLVRSETEPLSASLFSLAQENAGDYEPSWVQNSSSTTSTSSQAVSGLLQYPTVFSTDIYGEGINHVHLMTKGERVVRANVSVPTASKVYGFRFAIDNFFPNAGNDTVSFILGLAPSPSSFHISDGSIGLGPFWGVDNRGHIIESRLDFVQSIISRSDQNIVLSTSNGNSLIGRRRYLTNNSLNLQRATSMSNSLPPDESMINHTAEATSSEKVITVIVDNNSRLITFMKGDGTIGSTTKSFPASALLYPVSLSYTTGSILAICGLKSDPLGMIIDFKDKLLRLQQQRHDERREEVRGLLSKLIHAGQPTTELEDALRCIFLWFVQDENSSAESIGRLSAARLWYRSGLKLSTLDNIIESHLKKGTDSVHSALITFADYFGIVCSAISAENEAFDSQSFEIGDEVEVCDDVDLHHPGKNSFHPGDQGIIIDIRNANEPSKQSIQLMSFDKRPYWIESRHLYSARSGLIESPCLRFLSRLLRRHGYEPRTLKSRVGSSLSDASWKTGDLVAISGNKSREMSLSAIGRVCDVLKSHGIVNNSSVIEASSSKVTVEFYDSSIWRNNCAGSSVTQRISGLVSSLPINSFSPTTLVFAGLNNGLFRSNVSKLESGTEKSLSKSDLSESPISLPMNPLSNYNFEIEVEESNNSKSSGSLASKISALEKLDSSAISSLRSMIRDDSSIITKLCSQGLLDSISKCLDKILQIFVGAVGDSRIVSNKVDVAILRALIHVVFMICEKIFEPKKSQCSSDEHGEDISKLLTSVETIAEKSGTIRAFVRGTSDAIIKVIKETSSTSQDIMRITSLVERGLLCNDEKWVSKALNASYQRNASSSSNKILIDSDGDSILNLAISFGCSTNIVKSLIKVGCAVSSKDIKMAAVTNQTDTLLFLLRYSSYEDGSLDLNSCTDDIRDILENAIKRQKKEGSYLAEVGHSFTSNAVTKLLHILYTAQDYGRQPNAPSYFNDIAQLLQYALLGNISISEKTFDMTILRDTSSSSRINKGKVDDHVNHKSTFFQLIPEILLSQSISSKCTVLSDSIPPIKYALNLIESLLSTKEKSENYAGFVLASFIFQSSIDLSSDDLERYGFRELFQVHSHRLEIACKTGTNNNNKRSTVTCPQGHEAVYHITDKNSFRCDLCDRAIKVGKRLHGCRLCDWDICELCLPSDEHDASSKLNEVFDICRKAYYERYAGEAQLNEELISIARGIRDADRESLRKLGVLLNIRGQVPLHSFNKIFLPVIYSSALECIRNGPHLPINFGMESTASFVPKRKKPRTDAPIGRLANPDFLDMLIDELILPALQKNNAPVSPSADLVYDENDIDEDGSDDEESHVSEPATIPAFLRLMHQLLAMYEDWSVARFVSSKQSELESLGSPISMELNLVEDGAEISRSLIAEPTVSISDVYKRIIQMSASIESKYLNYCRRLQSSHILISDKASEWKIARILEFDESTGAHILQYENGHRHSNDDSLTLSEMFNFRPEKKSVILYTRNYFLINEGQGWLGNFSDDCILGKTEQPSMNPSTSILKRSWSALSLSEETTSADMNISCDYELDSRLNDDVGDSGINYIRNHFTFFSPPKISVLIALGRDASTFSLESLKDETLFNLLYVLAKDPTTLQKILNDRCVQLIVNVQWSPLLSVSDGTVVESLNTTSSCRTSLVVCDGVNETVLSIMHLLSIIYTKCKRLRGDGLQGSTALALPERYFEVHILNHKLQNQINDSLAVVCNAMPGWCTSLPSYFPIIFSHKTRRLLLERAYFGVSRSTIRQQEAKVSVSSLRAQMSRMRSRAVELMAEAFSGTVSDPTALQHQADELYSLEEAIKAKISAVFAGQHWHERILKRARAVVSRGNIVNDTAKIMENFAGGSRIKMRRLEVRFLGESGFDASDDEAGVTRGFYADLAEALLSCCLGPLSFSDRKFFIQDSLRSSLCLESSPTITSIPLWIADFDVSHQIIIPTPRANPKSTPGIFPRPICSSYPRKEQILSHFRLIGRVFASAMRDNFVFPLPLSASFLKLIQGGRKCQVNLWSYDNRCNNNKLWDEFHTRFDDRFILDSYDLPRPGFVGGEIFAVEELCKELDELDSITHLLTMEEYDKRKNALAHDRTFTTRTMGTRFEASFAEWFEGKRFVDPFDPAQDMTSAQLCIDGHKKSVTIDNVREWANLAKRFVLYDGVIEQALAFRKGVEDFFPSSALLLFTAEELQQDVCGGGDNVSDWDDKAIRSLLKLDVYESSESDGEIGSDDLIRRFTKSSATVLYLIRTLLEAKEIARRQFLSFVTSLPICTPGKIEVVPIIGPSGEFLSVSERCLPRANTCGRRLYLPFFKNYEEFNKIFWSVVSQECKFKGFFEWRG